MTKPVELVLSRYTEDLSWAYGLGVPLRIYNKGEFGDLGWRKLKDTTYYNLTNVGREAHTYLHHIVTCYDDLADWTVFCQGSLLPHLTLPELCRLLRPSWGFTCCGIIKVKEWRADGHINWQLIREQTGWHAPEIQPARLNLLQWFAERLGIEQVPRDFLAYTPGAIFGVPASLIRSYPREFYQTLLTDVSGHVHPEEAHYLERVWLTLFTGGGRPPATDLRTPTGLLYACQPGYGEGKKASKRQFWTKSIDPRGPYAGMQSVFDDHGNSLLADAFNLHWKTALNMQLAGQNVTRFAMLHDDVIPEDFWLEKLLAELDRTGADLVAAVVPIKDGRGLSSTALDDPEDPWEVYRRLTMAEVHQLPETFSTGDCLRAGYTDRLPHRALLANTGCWVCDFTRPWRFRVHFQIHNRIAFVLGKDFPLWWGGVNRELKAGDVIPNHIYEEGMTGAFINQVMSEDWDFSRQLAKLGCKVLATRKVNVHHLGDFPFPSGDGTWGQWQHDETMRKKWDPNGSTSNGTSESSEVGAGSGEPAPDTTDATTQAATSS